MQLEYIRAILTSIIAGIFLSAGVGNSLNERIEEPVQEPPSTVRILVVPDRLNTRNAIDSITFKHGDISWLPILAKEAGWPRKTWEQLGQIILRESGGCPNRVGGDAVDKNCNITHVTEWNHRSDTGLLQINGVNYDISRNKWARICLDLNICQQSPLLDPLTNLKAGYLLYQYSGWGPWDPCTWGPKYAHRCKPSK